MKRISFRSITVFFNKVVLFPLACALSLMAFSTVALEEPASLPQNEQSDLEVIDVEGERHLSYYRRNLHKAEDAFFSMMNELVTDDDFKVTCETQRMQAFSRLKTRACEAKFVSRLIGEKTQRSFDLMSPRKKARGDFGAEASLNIPTSIELQKDLNKRRKEYLEELVKQINSNPELLKAFNELQIAKQKYEQSRL